MAWTWVKRIGWGLLALVAVLAAVPAATVAPLVRDDLALDHIVVAVALDWRDFGADVARQRLQYELDHRAIGRHVADDDCWLEEEPDRVRRVACAWEVSVTLPTLEEPLPLAFRSAARIDRNGVLLR